MNKIGHSSPTFCHDPIAKTAKAIQDQGFEVWEIVAEGLHDPWEHRVEFKDVLPSYNLKTQLHAPLSDANLGSIVPEFWELSVRHVERALRGAAIIGATRVTIHPGNHTALSRGHYKKLHAQARKAVKRLDKTGRDLGLELCLENMPTGWAFETDSLEKLLDLTEGTEFKLCYDLGHAHVAQRLKEFDKAAKKIANVHLSDNKGDFDAHLTLDEGTLPWRDSLAKLLKGGYKGTFVVESRTHDSGAQSQRLLEALLRKT